MVQWGDAVATLASAAVFRLLETGGATAPVGFGSEGEPVVTNAIADLAVTGVDNLTDFLHAATDTGVVDNPAFRSRVAAAGSVAAARLGATLVRGREGDVASADQS